MFPRPAAPPPRPSVNRVSVFRSTLVEIRENHCLRTDPSISTPTAPLPFHEIVIPRRGCWIRHLEQEQLVVDPNHVHFFNRGEVHRVEHPHGCGDVNTGLILPDDSLLDVLRAVDPRAEERRERPFPRAMV